MDNDPEPTSTLTEPRRPYGDLPGWILFFGSALFVIVLLRTSVHDESGRPLLYIGTGVFVTCLLVAATLALHANRRPRPARAAPAHPAPLPRTQADVLDSIIAGIREGEIKPVDGANLIREAQAAFAHDIPPGEWTTTPPLSPAPRNNTRRPE